MSTVEMKVSELQGAALDWATAPVAGYDRGWLERNPSDVPRFSEDWALFGPLVRSNTVLFDTDDGSIIWARLPSQSLWKGGPNHLIAACRAVVAARFGDTVSVPSGLAEVAT